MISNQWQNTVSGIELRQVLPTAEPVGVPNLKFQSACGKWNECRPGDLFVAINGLECDGHENVAGAIQRGAIGVLAERLLPVSVPQFIVGDSRVAYGKICQALAGNPSQRISTIGVAGTAGKTVTAHLLENIFRAANKTTGLLSSIETKFGDTSNSPSSDSAPALAFELAKMVVGKCSHAIVETSSIGLSQRGYSGMKLDAVVVTNAFPANLHFHGNVENYANALSLMFDAVKPSGFGVFNADDKHSRPLVDLSQTPALTFGIHKPAEVRAKLLERNQSFQTFLISAGSETVVVRTSIIGKQHIYNCLAAATVGLTFGIDLDVIVKGLEATRLPGRLERVDCGQDFGVWIDSSLVPSHLNSAIAALSQVCEGKLWCVCSTDQSQSKNDRRQLGTILERKCETAVITQSFNQGAIDYEPCHQVLDGFKRPASAHVIPNRVQAIEWVLAQARPQDAVLICGAGEKPIVRAGAESWSITDRDVCTTVLNDMSQNAIESKSEIYRIDDYR